MANGPEGRGRKPFVIPPPTLAELGIIPFRDAPWHVRALRVLASSVFIATVAAAVGGYFWLDDLGVFRMDSALLRSFDGSLVRDNSVVLDRDGNKIGEYFARYHQYVPYSELPEGLVKAILAIEDRNFFSHRGVDPRAMLRALKVYFRTWDFKQGASTITQQVVRHNLLSKEKSIPRKVQELFLALRLEQALSKERILELYTNQLFLGNGAYGVGAAAQRYFGRDLRDLKMHEFALIAGLFQSPTFYNPSKYPERAKKRQTQVISAMYQARMLIEREALDLVKEELVYVPYKPVNVTVAPYFIDYVRQEAARILGKQVEGSGLRIYTTLDPVLQVHADAAFRESIDVFRKAEEIVTRPSSDADADAGHKIEGALLATDPANGEILAMVGGRDYQVSKFNRTVQSRRSPGSAFKPIVYAAALENGARWSDVLFISPVSINGYRPKNYTDRFMSETTMLNAFYQSLNTATVELGARVGVEKVLDFARSFGIESEIKNEPGTMLGSSELTMLDVARIYGTFANGGMATKPVAIREIRSINGRLLYQATPSSQRVLSEQVSYLVTEGMRSVLQHGTGRSAMHLSDLAVGKTGTSNNSEDNWFAGYSNNLLCVVWVGSDDHSPLPGKSAAGNTLALPIWVRFMAPGMANRKSTRFARPEGVVAMRIHPSYGYRNSQGVTMYFLQNNLPKGTHTDFEMISDQSGYRTLFSR